MVGENKFHKRWFDHHQDCSQPLQRRPGDNSAPEDTSLTLRHMLTKFYIGNWQASTCALLSTLLGSENSRLAHSHSSYKSDSGSCPARMSTLLGSENSRPAQEHKSSWRFESDCDSWLSPERLSTLPGSENSRPAHGHKSSWRFESDSVTLTVDCLLKDSTLPGSEYSRPEHGLKSSWWFESDTVTVDCLLKDSTLPGSVNSSLSHSHKSYESDGGSSPGRTVYQCHW